MAENTPKPRLVLDTVQNALCGPADGKPYLERVDNDDGTIRYEIHGGGEADEDGWMIVFDERDDKHASLHAGMMMGALLGGQDVPDR